MFKNIGKKIKTLTRVMFIIECVVIIALGVIGIGMLIALRGEHYSIGGIVLQILLVIAAVAAAVILSWISSFVLYGFGELIDLAVSIEKNTRKDIVTDAAKEPNKKLEAAEQYLSFTLKLKNEEAEMVLLRAINARNKAQDINFREKIARYIKETDFSIPVYGKVYAELLKGKTDTAIMSQDKDVNEVVEELSGYQDDENLLPNERIIKAIRHIKTSSLSRSAAETSNPETLKKILDENYEWLNKTIELE